MKVEKKHIVIKRGNGGLKVIGEDSFHSGVAHAYIAVFGMRGNVAFSRKNKPENGLLIELIDNQDGFVIVYKGVETLCQPKDAATIDIGWIGQEPPKVDIRAN